MYTGEYMWETEVYISERVTLSWTLKDESIMGQSRAGMCEDPKVRRRQAYLRSGNENGMAGWAM